MIIAVDSAPDKNNFDAVAQLPSSQGATLWHIITAAYIHPKKDTHAIAADR